MGCRSVGGWYQRGGLERTSPLRSRQNPQLMVPRLWVWDSKSMTIPPLLRAVPLPQLGQRIRDPGCVCSSASLNGAHLSLQHDDSITVHLWQLPNQMPRSPSSLLVSGLPIKWELYPGRRYRGTDSRFWEIVDHDQASAWWPM